MGSMGENFKKLKTRSGLQKLLIASIVVFSVFLLSSVAADRFEDQLSQIELSAEQKKAISEIQASRNTRVSSLKNKMSNKNEKLKKVMDRSSSSTKEIQELKKELGAIDEEINKIKFQSRRQIKDTLDNNQKKQLRNLRIGAYKK